MSAPRFDLAGYLEWLQTCGQLPCTGCRWEWQQLGRLHGISMGYGWVRVTTSPVCQEHG